MRVQWLTARIVAVSAALTMASALVGTGPGVAAASTCVGWAGTQPANPSIMGDQLAGVSVVSPCDAWAVGTQQVGAATFQTLAEHWNGLTWTPAKSSNPGGSSNTSLFSAVAVKSPTDGWAVGDYHNGTTGQTLIERLTGGAWKPVPSPDPGGPILYNALGAVTIISAKNAWAVGDYFPTPTTFRALIVHWNGAKWSVVSSPNPKLNKSLLLGVTATSAKDVWAVGFFNS